MSEPRWMQATWEDARTICEANAKSLPVIKTPRHNRALHTLLQHSTGGPVSAWIGLTDSAKINVTTEILGGGWKWVDGNFAGRPARISNPRWKGMKELNPAGYDGTPPSILEGDVPYLPGYHNWASGLPTYGDGECAWMNNVSGTWDSSPCNDPYHLQEVVCCASEATPSAESFSCSVGTIGEGIDWPLVPLFYRDDDAADDVPNSEVEVARGFANRNAYFVGNLALSELQIDRAELCVEDEATSKKLCLPLVDELFVYKGEMREGLNSSSVNNLHRAIAALSGQIMRGEAAAAEGADEDTNHGRIIAFEQFVGDLTTTNPSLCVQPQSTLFGEPMHCWGASFDDMLILHDIGKPYDASARAFFKTPNIDQFTMAPFNWLIKGVGLALDISSQGNELRFWHEGIGVFDQNGAPMPWTTMYV